MVTEEQFSTMLTRLGALDEGIKGMHRRQDITNGRIAKTEEKVIELDKKNVCIEGKIDVLQQRNIQMDDEYHERMKDGQDNRKYWSRIFIERAVWIAIAISMLVLARTGLIDIALTAI